MSDFNLAEFWAEEHAQHNNAVEATFNALQGDFESLLDACCKTIENSGKILLFGNGGSASDAQHIATELTIRYIQDRKPIAALALTTDTSALTAAGNDIGFENIFARQLDALGRSGDLAIGISTSGHSPNILRALEMAQQKKITTAGFSGRDGGVMRDYCDIMLTVPSHVTARIQEMHIVLGHMLCGALEKRLKLV